MQHGMARHKIITVSAGGISGMGGQADCKGPGGLRM